MHHLCGMKRTFVALDVPAATRAALCEVQAALRCLREPEARIRFTVPEQLHLTLKFLGGTGDAQVAPLLDALEAVAAGMGPLDAQLGGLGAFPSPTRPRALFAAIAHGAERVVALMEAVETACVGLSFAPEPRPRVPHVTLARLSDVVPRGRTCRWLAEAPRRPYGTVDGGALSLYESILRPGGSLYVPLGRFPLPG
ncbi:MAG TPA: RNA 2',3'-cyclic phosphodiesterase, partial [Myxococcota bacterium]|nr:RNA 2',3'-cyclic phosphodiesterase [Myxococcota bacterium]